MAQTPDLPVQHFRGSGGASLAYREVGSGRPVVLVHGFVSTAYVNWIRYGHAALLAERGFRVVMPDLRGHGDSMRSHDPADYPRDVLADDGFALLDHLGLDDGGYDLGGYSLGGRTVMRMLDRGARPGQAIVAGMGLEGILDTSHNQGFFERVLTNYGSYRHGDPEFLTQAFIKTVGQDPAALLQVIRTGVDTPLERIAAIDVPTLVMMGREDDEHGDGPGLADALPAGEYADIPGSHMGAVAEPELGQAIAEFLGRSDA